MTSLQSLAQELAITMASAEVWLSIGLALLLGGLCLVVGICVTRIVGLLERDAPAGETLGVGLGAGLMVLAAWWAAIWSGGRSSFTPVAIGFALAVGLALAGRVRRPRGADALELQVTDAHGVEPADSSEAHDAPLSIVAGGAFIVAVALLYGSTMAPSPRDGQQPVEFMDEAFYAILGRDLASTGTETNLSASGFSTVAGLPTQTWYHWGELWLAAIVVKLFGAEPLAARYFVVLPVALLADDIFLNQYWSGDAALLTPAAEGSHDAAGQSAAALFLDQQRPVVGD